MNECLRWTGHNYELACIDDLCHGSDLTLCGLEHGADFDVWDDYEDYDDEVYQ